jgi:hypothetical protein
MESDSVHVMPLSAGKEVAQHQRISKGLRKKVTCLLRKTLTEYKNISC